MSVPVQLGALETALINRRDGHEESVCAGRSENVLLAPSPDYLTNCRKDRRLLKPRLRQSQIHKCTSRGLIKKLLGLNVIVLIISSCSVPLRLGKLSFMIEQGCKICSSRLEKFKHSSVTGV